MSLDRPKLIALAGALGLILVVVLAIAVTSSGSETTTTTTTTTSSTTTTTEPEPVGPIAPLTGEIITDENAAALLDRPALVVKIDNADNKARPQWGLTNADVVFEPRVEGGVTRLMAVFHSRDSNPVGPVRSFRTTDVNILSALNRPLFAWHGTNQIALRTLNDAKASGWVVDVGINAASSDYFRERSRPSPHNSMTNTEQLFARAPEDAQPPDPLFFYGDPDAEVTAGEAVSGVRVDYGGGAGNAPVEWTWNASEGVYERVQNGTPHVDASGTQIAVENVIVQFTSYVNTAQVDLSGAAVPEAQTIGEGDAWILTGGRLIAARWAKAGPTEITFYTGADGEPVELMPGKTWVNLPPPGRASKTG